MPSMYDTFKFAPYEFAEFPMAVSLDANGVPTKETLDPETKKPRPQVIVQDENELRRLLDGTATVEGNGVRSEDDERVDLLSQAAMVGAKVDKKWPLDRIRSAIDAAVTQGNPL